MQFQRKCSNVNRQNENKCVTLLQQDSPLKSKVALFNAKADQHIKGQAVNPFSNDGKVGALPKPVISKDEYGK